MIEVNDTSVSLFLLTLIQSISEKDEAGNYVSEWTLLSGLSTHDVGPNHLTFVHDKTGELALFELKYTRLQTPHWKEAVESKLTGQEYTELYNGSKLLETLDEAHDDSL